MEITRDYTGHVSPGGNAAARELDALTIAKVSVGPMDNNAYLLACHRTGEALLIDAASDAQRILDTVDALTEILPQEPRLRTVVTTHRHPDHWQALSAVAGKTGAHLVAHPEDAGELPLPSDRLVEHGANVQVGESALEVIHLRGHTPGSIALLYRDPVGHNHLFTGDSLFPGGPGRTATTANFTQLMNDLETRVFQELPDDAWFYPGHGDDSTVGTERPQLDEWRARGW